MIHHGVKLWSNNDNPLFIQAAALCANKVFDFVELYIVPGSFNSAKFTVLQNIPVTLHATHEAHGFNLAQKNNTNKKILQEVFRFADFLNAQRIILHPGSGGNIQTTKDYLQNIKDKRILIENMPAQVMPEFGSEMCIGASIEEVKQILSLGFDFCLDFGHAVAASVAFNVPYQEYIANFMKLSPTYFHASDDRGQFPYDEHLNLGEGIIDYAWIKTHLLKLPQSWLVFETPKEGNDLANDVKNIDYFRNL